MLNELIDLRKIGVFGHAFIKKRRYWPKYVDGDGIDRRMPKKVVKAVVFR